MVEDDSRVSPTDNPLARWPSLNERDTGALPKPELYEDVPPHLDHHLRSWVSRVLNNEHELVRRVLTRLRVSWSTEYQVSPLDALTRLAAGETDLVFTPEKMDRLSVVNTIIALHPIWHEADKLEAIEEAGARVSSFHWSEASFNWYIRLDELERLLRDSGSAWMVDRKWRGLFRRVDPTATEAWRQARSTAEQSGQDKASRCLIEAWQAIYGQQPAPSFGYSAAVKAVEAAALPVVFPTKKATIHRVRDELQKNAHTWRFTLVQGDSVESGHGSITPVASMLDRLLRGETDRHASEGHNRPSTQEEAEAAVHLAVVLVQWFVSGAINSHLQA